jgi:SET domain-containing protein 6
MMNEAFGAERSPWAEYFAVLPPHLDSLVFWTPEELAQLQASAVVDKIGKDKAEHMFRQHLSPLGFNDRLVEFHHTASTIMAYAFDIPDDSTEENGNENGDDNGDEEDLVDDEEEENTTLAMIPLADMLNADAERNNARLCCDSEDLEMRTIKPIRQGEEIFNDYGLLPRSDLLRRYGYITDNYAPFDVVEIPTTLVVETFKSGMLYDQEGAILPRLSGSDIDARQELAEREDFFEESYDIKYTSEDEPGIPDELIALIYIFLVDHATFASLANSESSLSSRSKMSTALAGHVLKQLLEIREKQYATTLEDDEDILAQGVNSKRMAMAIQVRLGEKRVLRAAMQEASNFSGSNKRMHLVKKSLDDSEERRPAKRVRR